MEAIKQNYVELGQAIKKHRKEQGISTVEMQIDGIHPSLSKRIEGGAFDVTVPTLSKYINYIGLKLKVVEAE